MRVSEKIAMHVNSAEKVVFYKSSPEELVDAIVEYNGRTFLGANRLKEEIMRLYSSSELDKTKKELEKTRGSLDITLKTNEDLSRKLKIAIEEHSQCEVVKKSQSS